MGFCFPGYDKNGSDLPPRKECRMQWHDQVFSSMPQFELVLVIGQYAQAYHLGANRKSNMTQTVKAWREYIDGKPAILPLPHPSWRNSGWLKRNPWFAEEILPVLKKRVQDLL
jgi:uracil-DNA glycosylase